MESVTLDARVGESGRQREAPRNLRLRAVERRVEADHLRQRGLERVDLHEALRAEGLDQDLPILGGWLDQFILLHQPEQLLLHAGGRL